MPEDMDMQSDEISGGGSVKYKKRSVGIAGFKTGSFRKSAIRLSAFFRKCSGSFDSIHKEFIALYETKRQTGFSVSDAKELKKQYFKKQIRKLFSTASKTIFETPEEFQDFVRETVKDYMPSDDASQQELVPDLPTKAPILFNDYKKNPEHGEFNALQFLEHFYNPWLSGKGLYRGLISNWDPPLYSALYRMKSDIPNFDKLLPKSQGRKAKDLHKTDSEILEDRRSQSRKWAKANYKKT